MNKAAQSAVRERAENLRNAVQELEIEYEGQRVGPVTLSIGVAIFPEHGDNGRAVLQVADAALYRAKQAGRNRVVLGGAPSIIESSQIEVRATPQPRGDRLES